MINSKIKIIIVKIKRNIVGLIIFIFILSLIFFSKTNMEATKSALKLWALSLVPSLLPFFIAINLLSKTNMPNLLGKIFNKLMRPLFNLPGIASFPFLMGALSGYPMGAKIAVDFRNNNLCSKEECERILSFTNNSSPLFILGTIGINIFGNNAIGILLLTCHLLASLTVGFIFKFWKKDSKTFLNFKNNSKNNKLQNISFSSLGESLDNAITSSISTILIIGGFITIFSIIISIFKITGIIKIIEFILSPLFIFLNIPTEFISAIFTGILEITNGINIISSIHIKQISLNIILTSLLIGFGGISVLFQIYSIISKSDLSIKPYIYGKFLQGIISALYTYILINLFPFFNLNL